MTGSQFVPLAAALSILACSVFAVQPSGQSGEVGVELHITAAEGGILSLADGAKVDIPPDRLLADAKVSLRRVDRGSATGGFALPVGSRYEVDLGGQELLGPVRLEIPFDRGALPAGADASQVFLTYFDEEHGEWVFAGGEPDLARNVIVLEVDHASLWEPATWNWEAWAAALNGILSANIVSIFEGVAVLVDDCPQEGQSVWVDSTAASGLVQGCVERDHAQAPELRVVNPRAIYVEVQPMSGGGYFERTLLAPGESLPFRADAGDTSAFVVSADVTQSAGWHLAIHMTIAMLPGFNQFGFQGRTVACITERVADVSYLVSAAEALLEGNGAAAVEQIAEMYLKEDVMRRFITAADDCGYGPASTWSPEGIRIVGASLATIQSSLEFIPRFLANSHGEVAFRWRPQAVFGPDTIAYVGGAQGMTTAPLWAIENIWVTNGAGGVASQITFDSVYVPDSDGGVRRRYFSPAWSHAGDQFAFIESLVRVPVYEWSESIWIYRLGNGSTVRLGSFPLVNGYDWNPDGSSIEFGRSEGAGGMSSSPDQLVYGIWSIDLPSGDLRELVRPERGLPLIGPQWSPDGRHLAFSESLGVGGRGNFALYDFANGSYVAWGRILGQYSWTPDSQHLVFDGVVKGPEQGSRIWRVSISDMDEPVPLTEADSRVSALSPSVSPTGDRIAYFRIVPDTQSNGALWIMGSDGSSSQELLPEVYPQVVSWNREGDKVIVVREVDGITGCYSVDVSTGDVRWLVKGTQCVWRR